MTEDEETYPNELNVDLCFTVGEKKAGSLLDTEDSEVLLLSGLAQSCLMIVRASSRLLWIFWSLTCGNCYKL